MQGEGGGVAVKEGGIEKGQHIAEKVSNHVYVHFMMTWLNVSAFPL